MLLVPETPSIDELIRPTTPSAKRDRASSTDLIRVLLGILIPLVVIIVGLVVAEFVLRANVADGVRNAVAGTFHVDPSGVGVDLGPDLALVQAVNGQFEKVTVSVPGISIGDAAADATIVATGVSLDRSIPVGTIEGTLRVSEDSLAKLVTDSTGFTPTAVTVGDGVITTQTTLDLGIVGSFGASVSVRPGVGPGSVTLDPVTIDLGNGPIPVSDVRSIPVIGAFLAPALTAKEVCLADRLPAELDIERFAVVGDHVELRVGGAGVPLDATLATPGVCEQ